MRRDSKNGFPIGSAARPRTDNFDSNRGGTLTSAIARLLAACVILLALSITGGCGRQSGVPSRTPPPTSSGETTPTPTPVPTATPAPAPALSPRQMAGERVVYGYAGLTPPEDLLALISHGEAGGVIFFSDNISSVAQFRTAIQRLERANANSNNPIRAPLLLMIDQEGGQVRRLPGAPLLSEKQIGESADPAAAATSAGAEVGRGLRSIGLDVNLAPVLDVYRAAGDFDDKYGRSYSMNPSVVSQLGADFVTAQQAQGVAATAKHFPGLGAAGASQDTDEGSVTLKVPLGTLTAIDELPFKSAIGAGVKLVMVSWAVYPSVDPGVPAGLSSAVVKGHLRTMLGFKGVTITDGLLADALQPYGTVGHRAELAAEAGMDLLICAKLRSHPSVGVNALDALTDGYVEGTLDRSAFRASVQRIVALRYSLGN